MIILKMDDTVDRLLLLFDDIPNDIISNEIISFTEKNYKCKKKEKCNYCIDKPTKQWKFNKKIIKICKKCCYKYRNTFFI